MGVGMNRKCECWARLLVRGMALPVDLLSQELSVLFGHTITKHITHIE